MDTTRFINLGNKTVTKHLLDGRHENVQYIIMTRFSFYKKT